jgi:PIN domain nuclease of toxin-antitoxin system
VFVSAASAWEIAIKHRIGTLPEAGLLLRDFGGVIAAQGFAELSIDVSHALDAGSLDIAHRDPFGRMLIAQARAEALTLVSNERVFDLPGVARLW